MHTTAVETRLYPRISNRVLITARIRRIADYAFGLLYALLLSRLLLEFLSARRSAGVYETIRSLTAPFYAPFKYIVASSSIEGAPVVWPLVIAVVGYLMLQAAMHGLLRLIARG
jgi:uncharacterized protein YggT (Ycf19 family)